MNKDLIIAIICFVVTLIMVCLAFFVFTEQSYIDYILVAFGVLELVYIIYLVATGKGRK